jgi:starch synthase
LRSLADKYPDQFAFRLGFDEAVSRQVYAGADLFLMPSRFEPCGLGQMYAMRYGTVPVARATGGLKDTVTPNLGFRFREISKTAVFKALEKALEAYYRHPDEWRKLQVRGMREDFSWDRSAREYLELYRKLLSTGLYRLSNKSFENRADKSI